ncbi:hypothetical protein, partial [Lacticaseibacillus rhamnosus]|uniref:hypothetical protein n=1 Tax=Lacticaseibacillus rhamnosus TaxID=47715 RepID=UPI0021F09F14
FRGCLFLLFLVVTFFFSRLGIFGLFGWGFSLGICWAWVLLGIIRFTPVCFGLVDFICLFSRIIHCFGFCCFIRNRLFLG